MLSSLGLIWREIHSKFTRMHMSFLPMCLICSTTNFLLCAHNMRNCPHWGRQRKTSSELWSTFVLVPTAPWVQNDMPLLEIILLWLIIFYILSIYTTLRHYSWLQDHSEPIKEPFRFISVEIKPPLKFGNPQTLSYLLQNFFEVFWSTSTLQPSWAYF